MDSELKIYKDVVNRLCLTVEQDTDIGVMSIRSLDNIIGTSTQVLSSISEFYTQLLRLYAMSKITGRPIYKLAYDAGLVAPIGISEEQSSYISILFQELTGLGTSGSILDVRHKEQLINGVSKGNLSQIPDRDYIQWLFQWVNKFKLVLAICYSSDHSISQYTYISDNFETIQNMFNEFADTSPYTKNYGLELKRLSWGSTGDDSGMFISEQEWLSEKIILKRVYRSC